MITFKQLQEKFHSLQEKFIDAFEMELDAYGKATVELFVNPSPGVLRGMINQRDKRGDILRLIVTYDGKMYALNPYDEGAVVIHIDILNALQKKNLLSHKMTWAIKPESLKSFAAMSLYKKYNMVTFSESYDDNVLGEIEDNPELLEHYTNIVKKRTGIQRVEIDSPE